MQYISDLSFKEIYLYSQTPKTIYNVEIFQELTQNGKVEITEERLMSALQLLRKGTLKLFSAVETRTFCLMGRKAQLSIFAYFSIGGQRGYLFLL